MKSISRVNAEHYLWGGNCDGWHLVKNEMLSVIEEQMPPGTSEVRHYHCKAQQFFFVLAGSAEMELDGDKLGLVAGEGIHITPEMVHRISNAAGEPLRFLVISQPPSHGDRVVAKAAQTELPANSENGANF
jgi:mannose-6-phosphate isomerase-like protein (cupin superfamily)